jgi:type I restriction enzyme R subunit
MSPRIERETQNRVVKLLVRMGYTYLGSLQDQTSDNVRENDLENWLLATGRYDHQVVKSAVSILKREVSLNSHDDLYLKNQEVYQRLRYGVVVSRGANEPNVLVSLIDWKHPERNVFAVAEEVTVQGENTKRPDVVLYVNGIALGVLELKRGSVAVTNGIRQNLDNQSHRFIRPFFTTMQLVMAGNDSQGLYYGTINTPERFYLAWREDDALFDPNLSKLDQHIGQVLAKERFLDVIHNFVVFDSGVKKLCRPNQFFGIKRAQEHIRRKQGGIIWHTQGSGKSLTMVWLAKWIRENQKDARVLIITDRTELDEQIQKVFLGVDEKIHRTQSGKDLVKVLSESSPWLICSLIHKFGAGEDESEAEFIKNLSTPADFKPQGNLFVFIDECHRTQSGELHTAMKALLPDALFVGFTGTPLLKKDKKKSIEVFGVYIHTYKFNEAVEDGVVLDLLYEARNVEQRIVDQAGIDEWFNTVTRGMNELPKAQLKQQWGTMQRLLSSSERLERIAFDIVKDFRKIPRLRDGRGNAMLVASSIFEACRYYKIFRDNGFKKCAIVTSFEPTVQSLRGESTGHGESMAAEQFEIYESMLAGKNREQFEVDVKKQFIKEPAQMQLLIVVDKLLTGFDAPSCTYLYIDKKMRDHGLFQAICRVNRTESDDKQFGYIVDYMELFGELNDSIHDYTSDSFDTYEPSDIEGLLKDRLKTAKERLDDDLERLDRLCLPVLNPRELEQFIHYFCGDTEDEEEVKKQESKRHEFYKGVVALIRSFNNIASEMREAGYTESQEAAIKHEVLEYTELRDSIKLASGDYIDLKSYEPDMRLLLDQYLAADPSKILSKLGEQTLLDIIVQQGIQAATEALPIKTRASKDSVAETLQANVRRVITTEMPLNPIFYGKMSQLLTDLIAQRKQQTLDYQDFLKELEQLVNQIQSVSSRQDYPTTINTAGKQAIYDALNDEALANEVHRAVYSAKEDGWHGNILKERKVKYAIQDVVPSDKAEEVFDLVKQHNEYK